MAAYERLYVEFLYYFNVERNYFECHEVMEELWLENGRDPLLQGLLQVAVGLYHHANGNVNGAIKLFRQAVDKLQHYSGDSLGIDLTELLRESRLYLDKLLCIQESPFACYDLTIRILEPLLEEAVASLISNPPLPHEEETD